VIDIALLLIFIGLLIGFGYRNLAPRAVLLTTTDTEFYVTVRVEPLRHFSIDAINIGDIFFERHEQQPLGTVADIRTQPAMDIIKLLDGTPLLVEMEDKYTMFMTLRANGNRTDRGFFINGNTHVAEGSDMIIQSNMVACVARIYSISENLEG
jgi:hypothetical protein